MILLMLSPSIVSMPGMLDLRFIRDNLAAVRENTRNRNADANPNLVVELYDRRVEILKQVEELRHRRNQNAAKMKDKLPHEQRSGMIEEGRDIKRRIDELEQDLNSTEERLTEEALLIPNMSHPDCPVGVGDADNREIRRWGETRSFDFSPLDHVELGRRLSIIDFEAGAKVAGQKFYYLKNAGVLLELALVRYAFDVLAEEGFTLTGTPDVAKEDVALGTGFNPRGPESNIYRIEETDLCLIGTAEITLGGLYQGEILGADVLPVRLAGYSHCFRREAGAAGQYSKGLYRVHQFSKVEMFVYCHPDRSEEALLDILAIEERIFQEMGIPYRVVDTCTGDLGGPAYRKYDIEAWMPGRGEKGDWGEVTSASNCTDYQARRLQVRFKEDGRTRFVHTLNGTAIAVSRALIVLLENYQQADGSIEIPEVLHPYTGFHRISVG